MKNIKIADKRIGKGAPVFIVAEISANHAQDFKKALALIREAKKCGADAVKFQLFTPDSITVDVDNRYFRVRHPEWGGQTLFDLYKKTYTPWEWFGKLKKTADEEGIIFFSTALDKEGVDFLEKLGVPAHKNTSFELVDLELIKDMAATGKPVILSTGMASAAEIKEAVDTARKAGSKKIILLKCVSSYPADPAEMNLRTIPDMEKQFGCPVGLSDHSMGTGAAVAAVCLGARVIEKHFTLSRKIKTPDSFFSIEPGEMSDLVRNIRIAEKSLGKVHYGLTEKEKTSRAFRRSLFAVENIRKGEAITCDNVRSIRPGDGLKPKHIKTVMGKVAKKHVKKGTPLNWGHLR